MADVFISYAREDEPKARQLADALTARRWEVWWDNDITPGEQFSPVIQRQLEQASCVIVLWSRASIDSEYVRDEATDAKERGALVPALIDGVRPPLGFRQRQLVDLTAWTGDVGDREYLSLIDAVARLVSPRLTSDEAPPTRHRSQSIRPTHLHRPKARWRAWSLSPGDCRREACSWQRLRSS